MLKVVAFFIAWLASVALVVATMPPIDSHGYALGSTRTDLQSLTVAVNFFIENKGRAPSQAERLRALLGETDAPDARSAYLPRFPLDHWRRPFIYQASGANSKDFIIY